MGAVFMLCHLLLCFTMCLCDISGLEPGVFRKQPFYFIRGRGMDCVHLTPPDLTKWEYTGFVVVVVEEFAHNRVIHSPIGMAPF